MLATSNPGASRRISGAGSDNSVHAQIENLSNQIMEMKLTIEGLEKERDFYFGKLRDIEVRTAVADIEFRNKTLGYK